MSGKLGDPGARPAGLGNIAPMPAATESAVPAGMRDAHATQGFVPYMRDVWKRRSYIWYVSVSQVRSRQADTVFGGFWNILGPSLTVLIYYVVFGLLLDITRGVDNLLAFLTIGVFLFRITTEATTRGSNSIVANTGLIKSIQFPRVILPFTAVIAVWVANIFTIALMYIVAIVTGETPSARWLLLLPIAALLTVFNAGAAMVAARATTHFRDVTQFLPYMFRLLFYGSGVIFNVTAYAEGERWITALFTLNPMYAFITLARWTILGDEARGSVTPGLIISAVTWTVVLFIAGFIWFRNGEQEYARD